MFIDKDSDYHNIKIVEKSTYLTMLTCQPGSWNYVRLPIRISITGNMFQRKIDEAFRELLNIFQTADILVVVYDDSETCYNWPCYYW